MSTAFATDPAGSFLLVDEAQGRLVKLPRQGVKLAEATTRMLDADRFGNGRALAMDPVSQRMAVLLRSGAIFIMAPNS